MPISGDYEFEYDEDGWPTNMRVTKAANLRVMQMLVGCFEEKGPPLVLKFKPLKEDPVKIEMEGWIIETNKDNENLVDIQVVDDRCRGVLGVNPNIVSRLLRIYIDAVHSFPD